MIERTFLGTISFFADELNGVQLDRLASGACKAEYGDGSVIIREHDEGQSMFVIVSGTVEVSTRNVGRSTHVSTLHAGDIFGEISLLTGSRRSATVTAAGPVVSLEIDADALQPIIDTSPGIIMDFALMLLRRRTELDRIHGDGFWNLYGFPRDQIAPTIRDFFSHRRR